MTKSTSPVRLAEEQPIFRRSRRRRAVDPRDLERSQKDFWQHFDLEKFAADWQRGIGKHTARVE